MGGQQWWRLREAARWPREEYMVGRGRKAVVDRGGGGRGRGQCQWRCLGCGVAWQFWGEADQGQGQIQGRPSREDGEDGIRTNLSGPSR